VSGSRLAFRANDATNSPTVQNNTRTMQQVMKCYGAVQSPRVQSKAGLVTQI
jgi:hypothetical protein